MVPYRQLRDLYWRGLWLGLFVLRRALRDAGAERPRDPVRPAGGFAAGSAGVGEHLVERTVARETSGHQHVFGERRGEEAGRSLVVDGPVAGHVRERGRGGPTDGRDEQIALYLGAVGALHGAYVVSTHYPYDIAAPAGVHDAGDLDARAFEFLCGRIPALVRGEDDRPL